LNDVIIPLLRRVPLLEALPEPQLVALRARSRVRRHARGQTLFIQGEPAPSFFLIVEGWIAVYRGSVEGGRTVLHMLRRGETFAEPAALTLHRYPATAEAATDSVVLEIPASILEEAIRNDPDMALRVISILSRRLSSLVGEMERLKMKSAAQRVGSFLLELSPRDSGPVLVELPFDKNMVAARLGMQPESLSRALGRLKHYGVKTNRGPVVEIAQLETLREFCGQDSEYA
jgi:CRP-like cAMP-binding protein